MTKKKMFGVPFGMLAAGAVAYYLFTRNGGSILSNASGEQFFGMNPTTQHSRKYAHAMNGKPNRSWGRNELVDAYANASTREVSMSRMRSGSLVDINPSSDVVKVEETSLPPDLPELTDDSAAAIGSVFVKTRASMGRLLA